MLALDPAVALPFVEAMRPVANDVRSDADQHRPSLERPSLRGSEECRADAFAGASQPAGTFLAITALAWPGMLIEVDVTASTAK